VKFCFCYVAVPEASAARRFSIGLGCACLVLAAIWFRIIWKVSGVPRYLPENDSVVKLQVGTIVLTVLIGAFASECPYFTIIQFIFPWSYKAMKTEVIVVDSFMQTLYLPFSWSQIYLGLKHRSHKTLSPAHIAAALGCAW
jgi:hypothetical protein